MNLDLDKVIIPEEMEIKTLGLLLAKALSIYKLEYVNLFLGYQRQQNEIKRLKINQLEAKHDPIHHTT